jgi:phage terminase large subunit-like protein
MDQITQYALDVLEGVRVAGMPERLAAQRHLFDLSRSGQLHEDLARRVDEHRIGIRVRPEYDLEFPWEFDVDQALFVAVEWFGYLRHVEGPFVGQPIVLVPAHVFDIGCMFGWVSKKKTITRSDGRTTGVRRFKKAFLTEARKNAKTTRLAGVALYLMVGDMEASPDVYCAAVDKKQARELYEASKSMAEGSPDISARLKIGMHSMRHRTRGGKFEPFSGAVKNKDSFNPSGIIIDEYHAHPTSEIFDLMATAFGQRAQVLMTTITTAGNNVESPCHGEYLYCKRILEDPSLQERYFVMIRELDTKEPTDDEDKDTGDDEHDPKNWIKSNPLRCSTPEGIADLKEQHDEAFGSLLPDKIRAFRVKNLNIWVHGQANSYMGMYADKWDALALPREKFLELVRGRLCNNGDDLSKSIDLTATGFVFALDSERVAICAHGFIPEGGVVNHEKTDKVPYRDWAKGGWCTITPGNVTDFHKVQDHISNAEKKQGWRIHRLCYDPYNATMFATEQASAGYTVIEVRQGMRTLSEPTKLLRDLVASGKLVHDGSPLLKWCIFNAVNETDKNENIMLTKKNAGDTKRIDLAAAVIDALSEIQSLRDAVAFDSYVKSDEFGF